MAGITVTGVTTSMASSKLPTDTVIPSVAVPSGTVLKASGFTDLDGATIDNAVGATAFAAIRTAIGTYLSGTFLPDVVGIDVLGTTTVRGIITNVERIKKVTSTGAKANVKTQYEVCTDVFRVNFAVQYSYVPAP